MSAKRKILVVDDDKDFILPIRKLLESKGYMVLEAHNGKEGMDNALSQKPDLILLDVMMTRLSEGFDTFRELRANEDTRSIPVFMTTSINSEVPFNFGRDETWLPVDKFLEKPILPEKLLKEVEQALA
ncbi:MAG: response regulator [Spirochaetales bacterium]|nr:response regulator [Spirochaetales bacterium]